MVDIQVSNVYDHVQSCPINPYVAFQLEDLAPNPSPILPFLFLGNERDANVKSLEKLNIKYVLDITSQVSETCEKSGIRYKRLSAADSYHQNLIQYFEEAFEFIGEFLWLYFSQK